MNTLIEQIKKIKGIDSVSDLYVLGKNDGIVTLFEENDYLIGSNAITIIFSDHVVITFYEDTLFKTTQCWSAHIDDLDAGNKFEKGGYWYDAITQIYDILNNQCSNEQITFNMAAIIQRQRDFSEKTFGPNQRTAGIIDHIKKELMEIEQAPNDLNEWIDVALLAIDGAWRAGYSSAEIAAAYVAKIAKNEQRSWPDWRTVPEDQAIEHIK